MKLRFEQNKIYDEHSHKTYNPSDKTDMEILCNEVNAVIEKASIDVVMMEYKLGVIRMVCGYD